MSPEIPANVYYLVGLLILTNLGLIFSGIYFGGKIVWYFSKLDSRTKRNERVTAAHSAEIKDMKKQNYDFNTRLTVMESHQ